MAAAAQMYSGVVFEDGQYSARLTHPCFAKVLQAAHVHLCYCADAAVAAFLRDCIYIEAAQLLGVLATMAGERPALDDELNFTLDLAINHRRCARLPTHHYVCEHWAPVLHALWVVK